jgi:hypothetical protein
MEPLYKSANITIKVTYSADHSNIAFPKPRWPPIQDLESVDIAGQRKDGGVDLAIIASQPLDDSADTLQQHPPQSRALSRRDRPARVPGRPGTSAAGPDHHHPALQPANPPTRRRGDRGVPSPCGPARRAVDRPAKAFRTRRHAGLMTGIARRACIPPASLIRPAAQRGLPNQLAK